MAQKWPKMPDFQTKNCIEPPKSIFLGGTHLVLMYSTNDLYPAYFEANYLKK